MLEGISNILYQLTEYYGKKIQFIYTTDLMYYQNVGAICSKYDV